MVMAKQKETSREELARFPQFAPDESYSPLYPKDREDEIKNVLTRCIRPRLQSVMFLDEQTSLDRFLRHAIHALAVYIHKSNSNRNFDRAQAACRLREAVGSVCTARERLESITGWPELTAFVESILVHAGKTNRNRGAEDEARKEFNQSSPQIRIDDREQQLRSLIRELRLHDKEREEFHKFSPQTLAAQLRRLEEVLMVAAERVKFQPGDYQRKDFVQKFVDEIAFAWICGTGQLPTYSKPSHRSRNQSPFADLLIAINGTILPDHIRSRNDFRDYGQNSVKLMKQMFPELLSI